VFDPDTYRDRHAVECDINLLEHRAVATRYDSSCCATPPPGKSPPSTSGYAPWRAALLKQFLDQGMAAQANALAGGPVRMTSG
jgi:hypothetical protein